MASALAATGAVATMSELVLARSAAGTDAMFFARAKDNGLAKPGSISGTTLVLKRCNDVVGGLMGALQPPDHARPARMACAQFSSDALARMPTNGLAALVGARLAFLNNDLATANGMLAHSQSVAAHEQWLAEARVAMAEDNFSQLSAQALEGHQKDLALLAQSARGVGTIAYRYVSDPGFRERITGIVEDLSPEVQQRFLDNVRRSARAFGFAGAGA